MISPSPSMNADIIAINSHRGGTVMPNLLVRNVDEDIIMALKAQAGEHCLSVEAEHRQILKAALHRPKARTLIQVLMDMPDAGLDEDFLRTGSQAGRSSDVPD